VPRRSQRKSCQRVGPGRKQKKARAADTGVRKQYSAADRPPGVGEAFGTLRFGRLAEILLYDIRRSQTLAGPSAVFVDGTVETWLKARMAARDVVHVVNIPTARRRPLPDLAGDCRFAPDEISVTAEQNVCHDRGQ